MRVQGLGFRVQGLGSGSSVGLRVWSLGSKVQDLGLRV